MAKVETVYRDGDNKRFVLSYSIDGVYWLSVLFKIAGILALVAAVPAICLGMMYLLDSPTKPLLGMLSLVGGTVGGAVGYYFFFGLANTVCLLLDIRGRLDRTKAKE